ncbi:hypothetical protein BV090_00050 [Haemophilus influenzae]|nr:hypothetical protein BV090_00050 [Haemophilus influenzae]
MKFPKTLITSAILGFSLASFHSIYCLGGYAGTAIPTRS